MVRRFVRFLALVPGLVLAGAAVRASACPFCSAVSQTLSEEMASMDAAVIVRLAKAPAAQSPRATGTELARTQFQIVHVLKGGDLLTDKRTVETVYLGEAKPGQRFVIMGVDPPHLMWSTPLAISERAQEYMQEIVRLPAEGPERLAYFQKYLEDEDQLLSRDAYDEFAKAPYSELRLLKPHMDHDQLVRWVRDTDIPASRRRLYLIMLSVCGSAQDLPMLDAMLASADRKQRAGLDALITAYLTLAGEAGLPKISDMFLRNKQAEYADTYSAIMALRFHGTDGGVLSKDQVLEGLRIMLDRPELADLVIPDLARWEDWSQMERLVELFKNADAKSMYVRMPVINYLRVCPLPKAKEYIAELEKIDPGAVKRANVFLTPSGGAGNTKRTSAGKKG